jgi:hypothetical protein
MLAGRAPGPNKNDCNHKKTWSKVIEDEISESELYFSPGLFAGLQKVASLLHLRSSNPE